MATVELAKGLAEECGFFVFPVVHGEDNSKKPLTKEGHLNATRDPGLIEDWWAKWPTAKVGVAMGVSNLIALDIDTKNNKDGFDSLDQAGLDIPETYSYETGTGGSHYIYRAPEGVELNGQANYRKLEGVDRRGGSSWVMWVGDIPFDGEITNAPEWLCDPSTVRREYQFKGDLKDWFEKLTPGEPNALVRKAWERADARYRENGEDFSHSDLVEIQYEAVRLGCEGNSGVPQFLDHLEELFFNRKGEHTRSEEDWAFEWEESLDGALSKYGDLTDLVKNLPPYSIGIVPASVPDVMITRPGGKSEFSRLLGKLVSEVSDDDRIATILWNCPATRDISRDWGLSFVYHRITQARVVPEPTRENPKVEEHRERVKEEVDSLELLTQEERDYLKVRPTFVDRVENIAIELGYDQLAYFRSIGWTLGSLAFGFKGFIPVSKTQWHGVNLWNITVGDSGTGKSTVIDFRDKAARGLFEGDANDGGVGYDLGTDSSPQGLHLALLERDGRASLFAADEASGFFKQLGKNDWNTGLEDTLSAWYMGYVAPSNKISLKELRGKSAKTSFNVQMFATPDRLTESLTRDQFTSGFLARFNWVIGNPKIESDERFNIFKNLDGGEEQEFEDTPGIIQEVINDLKAAQLAYPKPAVLKPTAEAGARLSKAYKRMTRLAERRENWDIVEPSVTRLMEAMLKCAGICAMYREDTVITMDDALHGIKAVEEWFGNLFIVADMISSGEFQRDCEAIVDWVKIKGGKATRAELYYRFKNIIQKDPRELESRINYLIESGELNRDDSGGGAIKYEINGSIV